MCCNTRKENKGSELAGPRYDSTVRGYTHTKRRGEAEGISLILPEVLTQKNASNAVTSCTSKMSGTICQGWGRKGGERDDGKISPLRKEQG